MFSEDFHPEKVGDLYHGSDPSLTENGSIKGKPEDFIVEEIPAVAPSGAGEYLYLWLEKRNLSHDQLCQVLSQSLGVPYRDIGAAGLKDKRSVSRQHISVPASYENQLCKISDSDVNILDVSRHHQKLKTGYIKGNRFRIKVHEVGSLVDAETRLNEVVTNGVPNFFGRQRFGSKGDTGYIGCAILRGNPVPKKFQMGHWKRLALSAAQSMIFNHYLHRRICEYPRSQLLPGDVMKKNGGGVFRVEDMTSEQQRFLSGETNLLGPLPGKKLFPAADKALEFENKCLSELGLDDELFNKLGKKLPGARRALWVRFEDISLVMDGKTANYSFDLPSGSYATVVLTQLLGTYPREYKMD